MSSTVSLLNRQTYLRRGSQGHEVRSLQDLLRSRGVYNGPSNGNFDAATQAAVRKFQRTNGARVDGTVGDQTWAKLLGRADTFEPGRRHVGRPGAGYNPQAPAGAPERVVPESIRQSIIDDARQRPPELNPAI